MLIATAGHVDHGKTSLIKNLTGVDTDRLEEEKRRGLSINLGYAYLPHSNGMPLGFIDVPGHQRFINTMISGVSGIDLALLVVAADDGVMPQTREHLDILQLLGVQKIVAAVTKVDRVDQARISLVEKSIQGEVDNREMSLLDVFAIDNIEGTGTAALRTFLLEQDVTTQAASTDKHFHLSIDRAFNIKGAGLVVTGTVAAGSASAGDSLVLMPHNKDVRVRSLRVHDEDAGTVCMGQRCALNLGGDISLQEVARGDWLSTRDSSATSNRIDVEFSLRTDLAFSLKQFAPVKLYLGARRVSGRIYFLPGAKGGESTPIRLAQLVLDEPVGSYWGQRFILRDHAENVLLGGGKVLDPFARKSGKSSARRMELLQALHQASARECLEQLLRVSGVVEVAGFSSAFNLKVAHVDDIKPPQAIDLESAGKRFFLTQEYWRELTDTLHEHLRAWHEHKPSESGINAGELANQLQRSADAALVRAALSKALQAGTIKLADGIVSLAGHSPRLPAAHELALQKVLPLIEKSGIQIPLFSELLEQTGLEKSLLEKTLQNAVRQGALHKISDRRHALPSDLRALAEEINAMAAANEEISVILVKKRFGIGRNLTVEILEYFDTIRFTQRRGQERVVIDTTLPGRLYSI
jgi:selenocysteine-specific elongation factor